MWPNQLWLFFDRVHDCAAGLDVQHDRQGSKISVVYGCHASTIGTSISQGHLRSVDAGEKLMAFCSLDEILRPDVRYESLCVVESGVVRVMELRDHHATIAGVVLAGAPPLEVCHAFDLARNALLYAYFTYDLLVLGELQAFGVFELSLKHRLNGHGCPSRGTLRNLVDRARKVGIFAPKPSTDQQFSDPIGALIVLRNNLSHGTSEIHSPAMALTILEACATAIGTVYPAITPGGCPPKVYR